jgi:enoyl-CoA hydratase/carnithine racemase
VIQFKHNRFHWHRKGEIMAFENLQVNIGEDFVAELVLNRPRQLNTFNSPMAAELVQALRQLNEDATARVIVLKGAGKAFCAGIDIHEYFDKTANEYRDWVERMEAPLVEITRMRKPVIAQVQGVAAANGAGLLAAADLAVAADNARIGLTAINVGLNCVGPVVPVARSVGRKRAMELLLFGELIPAGKALEMGLVNKIIAADDLDMETARWARALAQKSPVALQIAKKAFYTAEDMDYKAAFDYMNEAFAGLCTTEDAAEGIRAFLEKRKPEWRER